MHSFPLNSETQCTQPYRELPILRGSLKANSQQDYSVTKWKRHITHQTNTTRHVKGPT